MQATIRQSTPNKLTAEHDAFLDECLRVDGAAPIGDGPRRALERHADSAAATTVFELRIEGDRLIGLAVLGPDGERLTAELAIDPASRAHGYGRRLVSAVLEASANRAAPNRTAAGAEREPWFWAHGDHPGAARLAELYGMRRARELVQMRRRESGTDALPDPELPPGVHVRTFRPGADDDEWLRVNNAAFSWHPEQGGQTEADLQIAFKQPDFDPDGFFVAVPDDDPDRILGFHWTKVHPGEGRLGEVFVLGVDPDAHSRGLGRALTVIGLRYLLGVGVGEIELYTEGDNEKALGLYRSLGFQVHATDVSYTRGHEGQ